MIKKCPDCGSLNVEEVFDGEAYCKNCHLHCSVFDLEYATVFDQIKQSPEVMAETIVYEECEHSILNEKGCGAIFTGGWTSPIIEYSYSTKSEAYAATVAKLEEVAKDEQ